MKKIAAMVVGGIAVGLAGSAVAASRNMHVLNVALPDGAIAHVQYSGNVAPKVTIEPAMTPDGAWMPFPSFASFDRMIAQMNRQSEAMIRQAQQMARQPGAVGATPYVASFGNMPVGMTSTTVVSYSNGRSSCTRTTETVSQGVGKPPKVTSSVSGNCGASAAPVQRAPSSAPISRT